VPNRNPIVPKPKKVVDPDDTLTPREEALLAKTEMQMHRGEYVTLARLGVRGTRVGRASRPAAGLRAGFSLLRVIDSSTGERGADAPRRPEGPPHIGTMKDTAAGVDCNRRKFVIRIIITRS
jgi:hypothetical protein